MNERAVGSLHHSTDRAMGMLVLVLLAAAAATTAGGEARPSGGVAFSVHNGAANTAGGKRFSAVIGEEYARGVLEEATRAAWRLFNQNDESHRKPVAAVTLTVVPRIDGGRASSFTREGQIQLSAEFLAGNWARTDAKMAATGLLFHEVARVWEYDGEGHGNAAILEGIADLVRLRAGYGAADWVQPGQGGRWDQRGNGVTARFLEHLEKQRLGLVAAVNAGLKKQVPNGGVDLFKVITGKSVTELWAEYKSVYAAA